MSRTALYKNLAAALAVFQSSYVENVTEGPDAERVIRDLTSTGHKLIFTPSLGYMKRSTGPTTRYRRGQLAPFSCQAGDAG